MNCATGKGVTVKAKDKRYPTREIRKLDGKQHRERWWQSPDCLRKPKLYIGFRHEELSCEGRGD